MVHQIVGFVVGVGLVIGMNVGTFSKLFRSPQYRQRGLIAAVLFYGFLVLLLPIWYAHHHPLWQVYVNKNGDIVLASCWIWALGMDYAIGKQERKVGRARV